MMDSALRGMKHLEEMNTNVFSDAELEYARVKQVAIQDRHNDEWNGEHWNNRAARRAGKA